LTEKIMAAKVDENRRSGKNIRYLIFVVIREYNYCAQITDIQHNK